MREARETAARCDHGGGCRGLQPADGGQRGRHARRRCASISRDFFEPAVARHDGRIFKSHGRRLPGRVRQRHRGGGRRHRNPARPGGATPACRRTGHPLRIGINLGDVWCRATTSIGDDVNLASRMVGLRRRAASPARPASASRSAPSSTSPSRISAKRPCATSRGRCMSSSSIRQRAHAGRPQRAAASSQRRTHLARRAALHQHERRSRAGVFLRRHHRRPHHRSLQRLRTLRAEPQHRVQAQGPARQHGGDRRAISAWAICCTAACARPAPRCGSPRSSPRAPAAARSGPTATTATSPTSSRCRTRSPSRSSRSSRSSCCRASARRSSRRRRRMSRPIPISARPRLLPPRLAHLLQAGQAHVREGHRTRSRLCPRLCRPRRLRCLPLHGLQRGHGGRGAAQQREGAGARAETCRGPCLARAGAVHRAPLCASRRPSSQWRWRPIPICSSCTISMAASCYAQGRLEETARHWERAAEIKPEDYQTLILLNQVYASLGREADAVRCAARGVERAEREFARRTRKIRALPISWQRRWPSSTR